MVWEVPNNLRAAEVGLAQSRIVVPLIGCQWGKLLVAPNYPLVN